METNTRPIRARKLPRKSNFDTRGRWVIDGVSPLVTIEAVGKADGWDNETAEKLAAQIAASLTSPNEKLCDGSEPPHVTKPKQT